MTVGFGKFKEVMKSLYFEKPEYNETKKNQESAISNTSSLNKL